MPNEGKGKGPSQRLLSCKKDTLVLSLLEMESCKRNFKGQDMAGSLKVSFDTSLLFNEMGI